ncbi:MAG: hypothetical protein IRY99_17950 [Isosphaeraceae bacterium]|nr:hypothetical protein [Isosphaeraceae bacterium]
MMIRSGKVLVLLLPLLTLLTAAQQAKKSPLRRRPPTAPAGKWIGQDGHDAVNTTPNPAPSGVQDIHIALTGLPPARTIAALEVVGLGGGAWAFPGRAERAAAVVVRSQGSTRADLYIEPYQRETGRPFQVKLSFDDGTSAEFWVTGGAADPGLRMPGAKLQARWIGQDGQDRTGPGPSVGPDGFQDVHIMIKNLPEQAPIKALAVHAPGGGAWQFGVNHRGLANAELVRRGTEADLFFSPKSNLSGRRLALSIVYANDKTDTVAVVAGPCDPRLRMPDPPPLPSVKPILLQARWLGQDGSRPEGPADVHVVLEGLPTGPIGAAALNDSARACWVCSLDGRTPIDVGPWALPLTFRRRDDPTKADLYFPPERDESGRSLLLRLVLPDGTSLIAPIAGGPCDVGRKARPLGLGVVLARPGDDLNNLANRHGTVKLAKGTYKLDRPLVLNQPVTISAEPGTTLVFSQKPEDAPWTAAIKIHEGHTTLDGFAVRFDGPIRWNGAVGFGPAVIGTTDNLDQGEHGPKTAITLTRLDLQSPPAASSWEEAVRLVRLTNAAGGRIEDNILKGGVVEFFHGPWHIAGNDYRGTVPQTYTGAVFAGHYTHDVVIEKNKAEPVGPSGKTWRFLALTLCGDNDVIRDNTIIHLGPRDDDQVPGQNAPEIILTESYQLHFEGRPRALSADGRVLSIPAPQGEPARTGDVVAILNGPQAGQWRRIAQRLDPQTYLMDEPLPPGDYDISIATGYVHETFEGNRIDARGSSVATGMYLAGNHFGLRVRNNHFLGAGAFRIVAFPTEAPGPWGWSHVPMLGAEILGNTIEDSPHGCVVAVEHGPLVKSSQGRIYLSATIKDTTIQWTEKFLAHHSRSGKPPGGLLLGEPGGLDPGEMVLIEQGSRASVPPGAKVRPALKVHSARVNGRTVSNHTAPLPVTAPKTR